MNAAHVLVRDAPWYRRGAFMDGLRAAGYQVDMHRPNTVSPGDVLVIWNRYNELHDLATRFERQGGIVLVAENGYAGINGIVPKFQAKVQTEESTMYALARSGHNGSGTWPVGGRERFDALGIEPAPWCDNVNGHILVCGQRGIGSPTMASPPDWHIKAAQWLAKRTARQINIRTHPGNDAPKRPLELDLRGAWACVVWSSGSGVEALLRGIPVFYDAPHWVASAGARPLRQWDEGPLRDDVRRQCALLALSWAQWTVAELRTGMPFKLLLSDGNLQGPT